MKKFRKPKPLTILWKGQKIQLKFDNIRFKEAIRLANWATKVAFYIKDRDSKKKGKQ